MLISLKETASKIKTETSWNPLKLFSLLNKEMSQKSLIN